MGCGVNRAIDCACSLGSTDSHALACVSHTPCKLVMHPPTTTTTHTPHEPGDRATMSSGKMTGRVLLGGRERKLKKFRQISAHVKQVCVLFG